MARKKIKKIVSSLKLENYAAEGKSVAHLEDGKTVFVTGAVPGDVVEIVLSKNKANYAEGQVLKILEPAADRVTPFCEHFGICGGCKWQMLPYEKQLKYKQQQVEDQISRIGKVKLPSILPIIGCMQDRLYRNKLEFTFCKDAYLTKEEMIQQRENPVERLPVLGFHAPKMFDKVVDIQHCHLQQEPTNRIKNLLRDYAIKNDLSFYSPREQIGWLRNLIIRISSLGEVMVNLIVKENIDQLIPMLDYLLKSVPEITSLHYTINPKVNDSIYDLKVITYFGKGFIEEKLEDFKFKISPKSFFQTNTLQAERLYKVVRDFADLSGKETVYDLYCGTGSIGIFVSKNARKIIGVETVADAITDAKENAKWNQLSNCSFFVGDVTDIVKEGFFEANGFPDVIITDPPRAGMTPKLIQQLIQIQSPKIVYVSCNPATQARDLQMLYPYYEITKLQPVDMFPQTHHIENVALLKLREEPLEVIENE